MANKKLHIVFGLGYYYPDSYGGTEAYVQILAQNLQKLGHRCTVLAPISGEDQFYHHEGLDVIRFAYQVPSREEIIGISPPHNLKQIVDLVLKLGADVFHLHSNTPALGVEHLHAIQEQGVFTVFTGHIPGIVCPRGDMLYQGVAPCDGLVQWHKCTDCLLQKRGWGKLQAKAVSLMLYPLRKWTLVQTKVPLFHVASRYQYFFNKLALGANRIVAVCEWLKVALIKNGLSSQNISVIRQVVNVAQPAPSNLIAQASKIRIGFIGRITPVKGLHELIDTFCSLQLASLELSIVGSATPEDENYYQSILKKTRNQTNISWEGALSGEAKDQWFNTLSLLCIPSVWLETGPIVALEALSFDCPVVGRNIGGLQELIVSNKNGFLYNSLDELKAYLSTLELQGESVLPKVQDTNFALITPQQQAEQMLAIYLS
ncbi:glycosyltransferase [Haliscomenobacter hydrossis]|uniref:Glycosyl transferase group 1 n=1 Tax=Haliscomenobacter hydrossis (strain ATCC 27775 / DSM 1100 / LMG 10767 / O) TaxID=760192 RepID=F4L443_HALH1|nr:glycosyltransferase [Haliscomenobacter hydrossis]AEE50741.1 glycosyl transferase group 1 [Haliscomenobacter hydrossis DSM 1100]